jgi:hypothetical protein
MPMSVRLILACALIVVGVPASFVLLNEVRDHFWPWAREPAHAVVHIQNDSPAPVTLRYSAATWAMLYPPTSPSPVASGDRSFQTLIVPEGSLKPVTLEFELTGGFNASPLVQSVPVMPDEHLLYSIDPMGYVTMRRGRESLVGYPVFGDPATDFASAQ